MKNTIRFFFAFSFALSLGSELYAQPKIYLLNPKTNEFQDNVIPNDQTNWEQNSGSQNDTPNWWMVDINGGVLEPGDTIYVYDYRECLFVHTSDHLECIWHPAEWSQYDISLLNAGKHIFNGTRLNLHSDDWYALSLTDTTPSTFDQSPAASAMMTSKQN